MSDILNFSANLRQLRLKLKKIDAKITALEKQNKNTRVWKLKKKKCEQDIKKAVNQWVNFEYEMMLQLENLKLIVPEYLGMPTADSVVLDSLVQYILAMKHEFVNKKVEIFPVILN